MTPCGRSDRVNDPAPLLRHVLASPSTSLLRPGGVPLQQRQKGQRLQNGRRCRWTRAVLAALHSAHRLPHTEHST